MGGGGEKKRGNSRRSLARRSDRFEMTSLSLFPDSGVGSTFISQLAIESLLIQTFYPVVLLSRIVYF